LSLGLLVVLPRIDTGLRVRFGCAWLKARTLSPAASRFMELLAEHDSDLVAHSAPSR
jgi:DNA-binding transcriptional LysR family regulator